MDWPLAWRTSSKVQASNGAAPKPALKQTSGASPRGTQDLASLVTAAVQAALKPLACQMSSLEARMNNLIGDVEELKLQDCASEEEEYDDMPRLAALAKRRNANAQGLRQRRIKRTGHTMLPSADCKQL